GYLAAARLGFISHALINLFIKAFKINMAEAQFEKASDYSNFNEFFTRPLKEGMRPLNQDPTIVAHPVDGAISQLGAIVDGKLIQAKNHNYSL
ncbi:phosphatidylserine decarboxylase, partial [Klebsiella pneumoniae]|uniref:phosphatidylserine decarboxylase n=1 Tax=Klebsiella pneumoniae TaxID=573 RepID=UPI003FD67AD7